MGRCLAAVRSTLGLLAALALLAGCGGVTRSATPSAAHSTLARAHRLALPVADPRGGPLTCTRSPVACRQGPHEVAEPKEGSGCGEANGVPKIWAHDGSSYRCLKIAESTY